MLGLMQIQIVQGLRKQSEPSQQAVFLQEAVWAHPQGIGQRERTASFAHWIMHKLSSLSAEHATPALKAIWDYKECHWFYREEAQKVLLRWKVLRPEEQELFGVS